MEGANQYNAEGHGLQVRDLRRLRVVEQYCLCTHMLAHALMARNAGAKLQVVRQSFLGNLHCLLTAYVTMQLCGAGCAQGRALRVPSAGAAAAPEALHLRPGSGHECQGMFSFLLCLPGVFMSNGCHVCRGRICICAVIYAAVVIAS